eukprot:7209822-Karenia_brevis.AAC.1
MDVDDNIPRVEAASKEVEHLETQLVSSIASLGADHDVVKAVKDSLEKAKAKLSGHAVIKDVSQIASARLALSKHRTKQEEDFK